MDPVLKYLPKNCMLNMYIKKKLVIAQKYIYGTHCCIVIRIFNFQSFNLEITVWIIEIVITPFISKQSYALMQVHEFHRNTGLIMKHFFSILLQISVTLPWGLLRDQWIRFIDLWPILTVCMCETLHDHPKHEHFVSLQKARNRSQYKCYPKKLENHKHNVNLYFSVLLQVR